MSSIAADEGKLPTALCHYTTASGLLGIVQSGSVFCSNIWFLNDAMEYRLGLSRIIAVFEQEAANLAATNALWGPIVGRLLDRLRFEQDNPSYTSSYVTSLSTEIDQLSQWRAYSNGEGGYCLVFDYAALESAARAQRCSTMPCFYDEHNMQTMLNGCVLKLREISANLEEEAKAGLGPRVEKLLKWCFANACVFKDPSFVPEQEWRILGRINMREEAQLKYRVRGATLIPYHEVKLWDSSTLVECCLKRIVVGPARHQSLNRVAVEGLLRTNGLAERVAVDVSQTSYREL
jgi:hypothetical protein